MTEPERELERPSPIRPRDLLRHARRAVARYPALVFAGDAPSADEISRVLGGLPQPSEGDYRRSVSAAYYALFHAVTIEAARFLVDRAGGFRRHRAARRFEHRDVRLVALWTSGAGSPPPQVASRVADLRQNEPVRRVAEDVGFLSNARRAADYDHFAHFTEARALGAIRVAARAVAAVEGRGFATTEGGRSFLDLVADQARSRT